MSSMPELWMWLDACLLLPINLLGIASSIFFVSMKRAKLCLFCNFFALTLTLRGLVTNSIQILMQNKEDKEATTAIYSNEKSVFIR